MKLSTGSIVFLDETALRSMTASTQVFSFTAQPHTPATSGVADQLVAGACGWR